MTMLLKKNLYLTIIALLLSYPLLAGADPVEQYIEKYAGLAKAEMERFGIPASIKLAQGILESNSGRSELALNSRNHFGIKCKNYWIGPAYYHPDDDYCPEGNLLDSCFRVYRSVEKSYRDHSIFLRHSTHYAPLFELEITDYRGWARGLQSIGYATNPRYAEMLINLIETHGLYRFDQTEITDKDERS